MAQCLKCNGTVPSADDSPFCEKCRPKDRSTRRSQVKTLVKAPQNTFTSYQAQKVMELVALAHAEGYLCGLAHAKHPDVFKNPAEDMKIAWAGSDVATALSNFI